MPAVESSERPKVPKLGRRKFVVGGLLGAVGLMARPETSAAAIDTAEWPQYRSGGPDGASVRYPTSWALDPGENRDLSLAPSLLYPHQSFALRTTSLKPPVDLSAEGGGLPDLSAYPTDAAIIWLMYYDQIVEGPPFSGLTLAGLRQVASEFDGFRFHLARFSNGSHSFLLWVWLGGRAANSTVAAIDASLRSIAVS